jgi:hypothetical protein
MDISSIKNTREFFWTNHSKYKLLQYALSPTMVKKVIRSPDRVETGIAPKTTAVMKRKDSKKTKREVWVMIQKHKAYSMKHETKKEEKMLLGAGSKTKIISAWIYPGVSPKGKDIYVPEDTLAEL